MNPAARHRRHRWIPALAFGLTVALASPGWAQERGATLSLSEAVELARRNNPSIQITRNEASEADWSVREAYGGLLPGASVSSGIQYQAPGSQRIGLFTSDEFGLGTTTGYLASSYTLGMSYRIAGETLLRPRLERANRDATYARIDAADFDLVAQVTRQYLAVRRAQDAVELSRRELERAEDNVRLAEARVEIGAEIELAAKRAQVDRGRVEVELLRAENALHTERLRLVEMLGVDFGPNIELTSEFGVFEPSWSEEELIDRAARQHPQLLALRASERAGESAMRMARSQYLPSLTLSVGWSGYTRQATNSDYLLDQYRDQMQTGFQQCQLTNEILGRLNPPMPSQDCAVFQADPRQEDRILANNRAFPFDFTRDPLTAQLQVTLPIFNGFVRERQIETARVAADNARHRLRQEELRLRTEIATAYQDVRTAYRAVELERRNVELAAEQLELSRERYRVGSVNFLELKDAETEMARAERAYLTAVYNFHEGLAMLSTAVGQPLSIMMEERE